MVTLNVHAWENCPSETNKWLSEGRQQILWEEYQVRTGIKLLVQNKPPVDKLVQFDFEADRAPVEFMYCLSGETKLLVMDKKKKSMSVSTTSGKSMLSYFPDTNGTCSTKAGIPLKSVGLQFHPKTLCHLLRGSGYTNLHSLYERIEDKTTCPFFTDSPLPLPIQITAQQILECPLAGPIRKMFLEYKAFELIYIQLSLLDSTILNTKKITSHEHRAVMNAHAVLMKNIVSPPPLVELAKEVGLTHTRLSKLFKILFGTTVYGFLRQERLECARRMLEDGRRNMAEVAYECGFSSPSHFSRAFSSRYGVQPKLYQTEHLKQVQQHTSTETGAEEI
jgi:AraC-like DNA-binding protein